MLVQTALNDNTATSILCRVPHIRRCPLDRRFHHIRRLSLHIVGDMRIQIKRHRDIGVSEPLLDDLAVDALSEQ
jgi:hypothetical protein